jgi:uncharacterized protein (TIGR00251 family)
MSNLFYEIKNETIELKIKTVPNSSKNQIVGVLDGALKIKISAPAVDGEANKKLVSFLAKEFKISKSEIKIKSGETSKTKILHINISGVVIDKLGVYI